MPVDRRADLEAELSPVFAQLAAAQRAADDLLAHARTDAQQRVSAAGAQAGGLIESALATADVERTRAAQERIAQAGAARDALLAAARSEAARIDRAAQERVPAVVERIAGELAAQPA
jgi:vacuolar-type H+-ATPase subunit H